MLDLAETSSYQEVTWCENLYSICIGSQGSAIQTCLYLIKHCGHFFACQLNVSCDSFQMCLKTLYCSLPQATEMRRAFREFPDDSSRRAKFGNKALNSLLIKKIGKLFQFLVGANKVGSPDHRRMTLFREVKHQR